MILLLAGFCLSGCIGTDVVDDPPVNNIPPTMVDGKLQGTFVSANGYKASGMAVLEDDNGDIILSFSDDFMASFALGTFIYLANNNSSGTSIRSNGIELDEIKKNGSHTFNVTQKFPGTTISQYKYVIVLCKPASIVFGYAEMN